LPDKINQAIEATKNKIQGDFFIEILQRDFTKIKGLHETMSYYVVPRRSCPTPHFDSTAFMYHRDSGDLERLWTIPNLTACLHLMNNRNEVGPEKYEILQDVLDFYNKKLLRRAKELNKEPEE
jgi:hypothetical protein